MKACKKCQRTMPVDEFYRHSQMADGHLNFCKECVKDRLREQRRNDPRVLARTRARGGFDHERMRRYRTPEANRAHCAVRRAIKRGDLVRPSACEECGDTTRIAEAAHADYGKPLDVRWLCRRCHCRWDVTAPKVGAAATPTAF